MVGIFEDGQICQRVGPFASEAEATRVMDEIKADWRRKTGNEGFYIGEDGKKHDEGLYDDLLDNPKADKHFAIQSFIELVAEGGHDEDTLLSLYQVTREEVEEWKKQNRK